MGAERTTDMVEGAAMAAWRVPGGAPPVVCVHGAGVSSRQTAPLLAAFDGRTEAWAVDLPGFGASDAGGRRWTVPGLADALVAWTHERALTAPCVLGQSLGTQVAVEAAARHPHDVGSLVLVGPTTDPEARSLPRLAEIDSDALAAWVAGHYPDGRSDVAFVGSANGALIHLAAALGAPWLPQTLLILVRRHGVPPEDGREDLRRMRPAGEALVRKNPDWRLHHMHDPNQDRLMIAHMCYFRVKWLRLPAAYRAFLRATLPRGGTLVVSDCSLRSPTTAVGERYVFQHGGLGGATRAELRHGGRRVRAFLRAQGADRRSFTAPEPDGEHPEAEWGFASELMADLAELADREGWRLVRLRHDEPESLSPAVADLYRDRYRRRG